MDNFDKLLKGLTKDRFYDKMKSFINNKFILTDIQQSILNDILNNNKIIIFKSNKIGMSRLLNMVMDAYYNLYKINGVFLENVSYITSKNIQDLQVSRNLIIDEFIILKGFMINTIVNGSELYKAIRYSEKLIITISNIELYKEFEKFFNEIEKNNIKIVEYIEDEKYNSIK